MPKNRKLSKIALIAVLVPLMNVYANPFEGVIEFVDINEAVADQAEQERQDDESSSSRLAPETSLRPKPRPDNLTHQNRTENESERERELQESENSGEQQGSTLPFTRPQPRPEISDLAPLTSPRPMPRPIVRSSPNVRVNIDNSVTISRPTIVVENQEIGISMRNDRNAICRRYDLDKVLEGEPVRSSSQRSPLVVYTDERGEMHSVSSERGQGGFVVDEITCYRPNRYHYTLSAFSVEKNLDHTYTINRPQVYRASRVMGLSDRNDLDTVCRLFGLSSHFKGQSLKVSENYESFGAFINQDGTFHSSSRNQTTINKITCLKNPTVRVETPRADLLIRSGDLQRDHFNSTRLNVQRTQ